MSFIAPKATTNCPSAILYPNIALLSLVFIVTITSWSSHEPFREPVSFIGAPGWLERTVREGGQCSVCNSAINAGGKDLLIKPPKSTAVGARARHIIAPLSGRTPALTVSIG